VVVVVARILEGEVTGAQRYTANEEFNGSQPLIFYFFF
jgi:hypothetical protein